MIRTTQIDKTEDAPKRGFLFISYALLVHFFCLSVLGIILNNTGFQLVMYGFSIDGYLRLGLLPIFVCYCFSAKGYLPRASRVILIAVLSIICLFLVQIVTIPQEFLHSHYSHMVKYLFIFMALAGLVLTMSRKGISEYKIISRVLIVIYFAILSGSIYYMIMGDLRTTLNPFVTAFAERLGFIMAAGNEDANGMMTLLPIILYRVKDKPFTLVLVLCATCLFLALNGTRSAELFFVFMMFVFFISISTKYPVLSSVSIILLLVAGNFFVTYFQQVFFHETAFGAEGIRSLSTASTVQGEGNLMGRISQIWIPIIIDTFQDAPIFGFGTAAHLLASNIYQYSDQGMESIATSFHNTYVYMFALGGFVGLGLYLLFICVLWIVSFKLIRCGNVMLRQEGKSLLLCTCGYMFWSSISNSNSLFGWTIFVFLVTLALALDRYAEETASVNTEGEVQIEIKTRPLTQVSPSRCVR